MFLRLFCTKFFKFFKKMNMYKFSIDVNCFLPWIYIKQVFTIDLNTTIIFGIFRIWAIWLISSPPSRFSIQSSAPSLKKILKYIFNLMSIAFLIFFCLVYSLLILFCSCFFLVFDLYDFSCFMLFWDLDSIWELGLCRIMLHM